MSEQLPIELRKAIEYCMAHSPFYQRMFASRGITEVNDLETFKNIPTTTKEDLQKSNEDFLCVGKSDIADYSSTSGTLGEPIFMAMTKNDLDRLALNESLTLSLAGITKDDTIQLMTTMDRRFMAGLAYYLGTQKIGAGMIRVGSGVPELQWDTIQTLKPTAIIAVPSFIVKLIEYAEANNIDHNASTVRKAICIGEPLRNEQLELNALGRRIKASWDIELYSTYASTEMSAAFSECEAGQGGHLPEDLLYAELIDDERNPVEDDGYGELVISTMGVEAMPLLRYRTGDICRMYYEKCACGRTSPRISPIVGRKKHMIKYKGTTFYPPALFNLLNDFDEIKNFVVELKYNELNTDELHINILSSDTSEDFLDRVKDHFKAKIRVTPNIDFIGEEELLKIQAPEKNRKPIKFIDHREG